MFDLQKLTVHVRFNGRSYDLPFEDLVLGESPADDDVRQALARHFDVSPETFAAYVVERHRTGNITVRPEAVFG
jgi:hypothetical protein